MKKTLRACIVILVVGLGSGGAWAGSAAEEVVVHDPYVRAVPPNTPNSAAFMALQNRGGGDHAVVRAESDVSKVTELHTHRKEGGMMKMTPVERITIGAGAETLLRPGGLHVMMLGLTKALKVGDEVTVTLVFEDGSEATINAPVKPVMAGMRQDTSHGMKGETKGRIEE